MLANKTLRLNYTTRAQGVRKVEVRRVRSYDIPTTEQRLEYSALSAEIALGCGQHCRHKKIQHSGTKMVSTQARRWRVLRHGLK